MTLSLIAFAALFALMLARLPIAFAMAIVGVTGFAALRGWEPALALLGQTAFDGARSYTLSVIPLFVFMGAVLARSGVAQGLFVAAERLMGRLPGGLALAAVASCGAFSAVCGSSLATAATMSRVAHPPMKRLGYADSFSAGAIAAGGTLGILIPPSVILIIYGLLTESDIGALFIAGILPGFLGLALYLLAALLTALAFPRLAPRRVETVSLSRRDRLGVAATLALFVFIMAGIYGGFFTPTEAAGMGAAASMLIALAMGAGWRSLGAAAVEAATTSAMIFAIVIGAELFANFVNFAGLPGALSDLVIDSGMSSWTVIALILLVYLLLGCVLESLSMILLTVPVFYPLLYSLDFGGWLADPDHLVIWFGILVVVATEISLITPPVGMNVFVLNAALPSVPLGAIFRGVLPFWIADLVRIALIAGLPGVSLWLVRAMG